MVWQRQRRVGAAIALGLAALSPLSGCVERRYTIRTNPPGALAIVNGEEIGRTPVSRSFTYYGDRDVTLMFDGHQTQRFNQPIKAPWYDNIFTEFFTENLVPFTVRDERDFTYQMQPTQVPSAPDLLNRGQELRSQAQAPPPARQGGILGALGW
ncbi:MAG: PEGA domain-containing protein [Thermoleophilia bacterium]|nr:PEGA domain-containing protein [Thermoleophilia bacterium]